MPNSRNVSAGKPKISGSVYVAPVGTTIPSDASSELSSTFKELGYVSDDGVTNSNSAQSTEIKSWGGDTVLVVQTSKEDTYKYKLIEVLNEEVLKFIYGSDNVTVTPATSTVGKKIAIKANSKEAVDHVIVIDMILNSGYIKRTVIPIGRIRDLEDIVYNDTDAIGYGVTLNCAPDTNGNTHYEYLQAPTSATNATGA